MDLSARLPRSLLIAILITTACAATDISKADNPSGQTFNVGFRVIDIDYPGGPKGNKLTVAVWYPTADPVQPYSYGGPTQGNVALDGTLLKKAGPFPLLVFSHGYGGGGIGSVFFTAQLAAKGWIVAAPDHHDRYSSVRSREGLLKDFDRSGLLRHAREISASSPQDREKYLYRLDELQLAIAGTLASRTFGRHIDRQKIAVGGHSFGGFTALGLCGTIKARRDPDIKGLLIFSSGAGGYLYSSAELARVGVPSMVFYGERERNKKRGDATMAELAATMFGSFPAPKYLLEVRRGTHFSFNNSFRDTAVSNLLSGTQKQFEVIRTYAIAFLQVYVAGRDEYRGALQNQSTMLTRYQKEPANQ